MSIQSTSSSSPALSRLDGLASCATDFWLLVGRVALCWVFLVTGWSHLAGNAGFAGYLTNLKAPAPEIMSWIAATAEFLIGVTLLLGLATRYGAMLGILFVIIATVLAHRYWEYPAAQLMGQYNNFLKNLSIFGGLIYVFVFGPGRFSVDGMMKK